MNIVIMEDEGIIALFFKEVIEDLNHKVVAVFDNSTALLDFLKSNQVDLIFMDINIRGQLDGIETANIVHDQYQNISIVFLTSYKDSDTIKNAQSVQPLGYLIKPVMESDLEAVLMVVQGYKLQRVATNNAVIHFLDYSYNLNTKTLFKEGVPLLLSYNEKVCLDMLIANKNNYVSTEQLIFTIWNKEENRIDSLRELIYRLRKKLPNLPLKSSSKIGYILDLT